MKLNRIIQQECSAATLPASFHEGNGGDSNKSQPTKYKTIMADPPWRYGVWGKASPSAYLVSGIREETNEEIPMPYQTMGVGEICAMKVGDLADNDCELYLWTTQKYLPESFDVVEAWGFRYCGVLTWCKTPRGTGQGGLYCPTTEFLIHARRGKMPQEKRRQNSTWWNVTRPHNCHSAKPEYFTDMIETMGDAPRLELFARRNRLGWDTWGNESFCHVDLVIP